MASGIKRKRPPTFQHYPVDRAKKLKQAWVVEAKIRSKWKAQKKKDGLATSSNLPVYDEEKIQHDVEDNSRSDCNDVQPATEISGEQPRPHLHPSRAHIHPELPVKHLKDKISDVPLTKKRKILKEDSQAVEPPSLRELKREAYSQSALHTFKSDSTRKRVQSMRGGSRGRGGGRGQPNMKLRVNVMLEKIKQNFA